MNHKEIAELQLKTAIELFTTERCFLSALTLAGAAEEILGKMLKEGDRALNKKKNDLSEMVQFICEKMGHVRDDKSKIELNKPRNAIKHLTDPMPTFCPEREAAKVIKRAIKNYRANYGLRVPQYIKNFEKVYYRSCSV